MYQGGRRDCLFALCGPKVIEGRDATQLKCRCGEVAEAGGYVEQADPAILVLRVDRGPWSFLSRSLRPVRA